MESKRCAPDMSGAQPAVHQYIYWGGGGGGE
jgi:hypothetical protein